MPGSSTSRGPQEWPPRVLGLLALASTASALSLANFQLITSNAIPSPCILAYNTPIAGCTTTDFMNGNQCSSLCINGLLEEASLVQAICGGLDVNAQSLLGLTLNNKLLDTLCPGSTVGTTTVRVTVQPSTSTRVASTTLSSRQTLTTTSSSAIVVTTATSSSTQTIISSSIISSVPSQTTSSTIQTSTASTAAITSGTAQATSIESTSTAAQPEATQGGGSPFDAVRQSRGICLGSTRSTQTLMAVLSIAVLLL
ncbi:hypothetical protein BKA67DRAFT_654362 [Truncatella angustata]|uniref:Uncharacterized protein n=1 Tax=Truncatella angustata TaxID=152316 RepID=A0A9P8UZU4_9PEZI|nr:uncharacterized protein BKA67DRAFT_654362 [Truncatella angustata]KAH6661237.1 hypothetical protein BKA67DRAFT_654362 [Truncatella angustata]